MLKLLSSLRAVLSPRIIAGILGVAVGFYLPSATPLITSFVDSFESQSVSSNQINLSLNPQPSFGCLNPRVEYAK